MTLDTYCTLFWRLTGLTPEQMDRNAVVELLHCGWSSAVEAVGGILALLKKDLVAGEENYRLDESVIRVHKVELVRGGDVVAVLVPSAPEMLERKHGGVPSGMPSFCSVKLQKYDDNPAAMTLRLWPAPDWSEADGLWISAGVLPEFSEDGAVRPDALGSLGMAGLKKACYDATGQVRFLRDYEMEVANWLRGRNLPPVYKRPLKLGRARRGG